MRRTLIICVCLILISFAPAKAEQSDILEWNGFYYRILADGTAEITGHSGLDFKHINYMTGRDNRIKELKIPSTVNGIPVSGIAAMAFYSGASLKKVTIEEGITTIGMWAFSGCNLETLSLPDSLRRIEESAFHENDNLRDFKMPDNLEYVGESAFWGCDSLTNVSFPDSVEFIGNGAFAFCEQLKEISIGAGLVYAGYSENKPRNTNPFHGWNRLSVIRVSENNPNFCIMDGALVDTRDMRLITYPQKKPDKTYTVPDGVCIIARNAFSQNSDLENLILPDSVETIEDFAVSQMTNLKTIVCGSGLKTIHDYGINTVDALESITLWQDTEFIGENVISSQKEVTVYLPWECYAADWARSRSFKAQFTQADLCRILTPAPGTSVSLTEADSLLIEWMPYPGADEYEIKLSFLLEGGDETFSYPTIYTDARQNENGLCYVEISPSGIFHDLWKAAGGSYVYLSWQAKVDITAYEIEN